TSSSPTAYWRASSVSCPVEKMRFFSVTLPTLRGEKRWGNLVIGAECSCLRRVNDVELLDGLNCFPHALEAFRDHEGVAAVVFLGFAGRVGESHPAIEDVAELVLGVVDLGLGGFGRPESRRQDARGIVVPVVGRGRRRRIDGGVAVESD